MKNYAIIIDNEVKQIAVFEKSPTFEPIEGYWLDVTGRKVGPGYIYNPSQDTFEEPLYVAPDMNIISGVDLWDRFEETEQESLVDSPNKKIKRFLYELRIRPSFDLKNQQLINAINVLEAAAIIGVGRAAEILSY